MSSKLKKDWTLTEEAWGTLLAFLSPDPDRAAELYLTIHAKLVTFFEYRNCPYPDRHADEVFDRVSRKVAEGIPISNPQGYFYGVARLLQKEIYKETERNHDVASNFYSMHSSRDENDEGDLTATCLDQCLEEMPEESRRTLLEYYEGSERERIERRKKMAERLNVTLNVLRIDTYRSRVKLQRCINNCCDELGK